MYEFSEKREQYTYEAAGIFTLTPHLEEFEKDKKVLIWSRVLATIMHTIQQPFHHTSMPGTEMENIQLFQWLGDKPGQEKKMCVLGGTDIFNMVRW